MIVSGDNAVVHERSRSALRNTAGWAVPTMSLLNGTSGLVDGNLIRLGATTARIGLDLPPGRVALRLVSLSENAFIQSKLHIAEHRPKPGEAGANYIWTEGDYEDYDDSNEDFLWHAEACVISGVSTSSGEQLPYSFSDRVFDVAKILPDYSKLDVLGSGERWVYMPYQGQWVKLVVNKTNAITSNWYISVDPRVVPLVDSSSIRTDLLLKDRLALFERFCMFAELYRAIGQFGGPSSGGTQLQYYNYGTKEWISDGPMFFWHQTRFEYGVFKPLAYTPNPGWLYHNDPEGYVRLHPWYSLWLNYRLTDNPRFRAILDIETPVGGDLIGVLYKEVD